MYTKKTSFKRKKKEKTISIINKKQNNSRIKNKDYNWQTKCKLGATFELAVSSKF
jgi:hypothetical protein